MIRHVEEAVLARPHDFQDMAAAGLITFDELGAKLDALEEARKTARRELVAIEGRKELLRAIERDRAALLEVTPA